MKTTRTVLTIKHLNKSFGGQLVFKNVNLSLQSGQIYGLLGPNGTGKTTLMKCILGLNKIESGQILLHEIEITNGQHPAQRAQIGSLIEHPLFDKHYTIEQVLQEQQQLMQVQTNPNYLTKVNHLLGIDSKFNTSVAKLSLGWKQKLGIAQAVVNYPQLLLLDEPFNGLDPVSIQAVEQLLAYLKVQGTCIIISSHILEELQMISQQLLVVKDYQIKLLSQVNNLKDYYLHQFTVMEKS